jgi:hypothetical protein
MFVISYDLNKQKDYQKLWTELKRLHSQKCLESVWIAKLQGTADSVIKHLTYFVDNDDSLIVAEIDPTKTAFKRPFEGAFEYIGKRA